MAQVKRWDIVTIGHLSRNKFWGEGPEKPLRGVLCTSTVVVTDLGNVVIDPSEPPEQFEKTLFENTGLHPSDIDYVFVTHFHLDHWIGAPLFKNATWYMSERDIENVKNAKWPGMDNSLYARFTPAPAEFLEGLFRTIALPGHSEGLTALQFQAPEGRILATGDCVMTKEFFEHGESYFFGADVATCEQSIRKAATLADVIIPGHGNYFVVKAHLINKT